MLFGACSIHVMTQPGLFGIVRSNRDFNDPETWGKNQFNSSFPAALGCYMHDQDMPANYIEFGSKGFQVSDIAIEDVYGTDPLGSDTFYAFESSYTLFAPLVVGRLPGTDLVVCSSSDASKQYHPLEIKLTALPDKATSQLTEAEYGSELVVRPDTILYLCCQLFLENSNLVKKVFKATKVDVRNNPDPEYAMSHLPNVIAVLNSLCAEPSLKSSPLLMQPVWKTLGQSSQLADNCLDIFIWSTRAFLSFVSEIGRGNSNQTMTRQMRTAVWIFAVLREFALNGKVNFAQVVDNLSYNTKNDKSFATNGRITNGYMKSKNLTRPRISKDEIKNIILGGGQNFLSPERRFDAIIVNSPEIFEP